MAMSRAVAVRHGGAVLSAHGGAPPRKEGTPMKKLNRFLWDVLATMAGTVLASVVVHVMGL